MHNSPIFNTKPALATIYESCRNHASGEAGVARWSDMLKRQLLGIEVDRNGSKRIKNPQMRPEEFAKGGNLAETAFSILGPNAVDIVCTPRHQLITRALYEAGNTAVQPSQFIDISSWDVTVGGLIEAKIIDEYRKPGYIMDKLFQKVPTNLHAQKIIGTGRVGDKALLMQPGQAHPAAQFTERFITTPYTMKYGLKCEVTKEAVFFDRTNQVLTRAGSVGLELGLRREYLMCDVFLGSVNPYSYGGASYNTYLTSGTWVNDLTGNSLNGGDIYNLQNMWVASQNMRDQESGQPISITPNTIVVPPSVKVTAAAIIRQQQFTALSSGSNTVYNSGLRTEAPPPEDLYGTKIGEYDLLWSPYLYKRMTDATSIGGMGLTPSQASNYWWATMGDEAFAWMENWDVNIVTVNANDYVMADQGIVMAAIGDFMGTPAVYEPRKALRNRL